MRKIDLENFRIATRGTSREINRQIALNLIRTHQPISRADLARKMNVRRGVVTVLVNELLEERKIFEGRTGQAPRGRKPTFLYIDSRNRSVVAVDIRVSRTYLQVADLLGRVIVPTETMATEREPGRMVERMAARIGDQTAHGGVIVMGCPMVMIGP